MDAEIKQVIDNVDDWVKDINTQIAKFNDVPKIIEENIGNIQHNYELIYELKDELEKLRNEIRVVKLVQIIALKGKFAKAIKDNLI